MANLPDPQFNYIDAHAVGANLTKGWKEAIDATGDMIFGALVALCEKAGGAVVAGVGACASGISTMASAVKSNVDASFSIGKPDSSPEPALARSKQIQQEVDTPAIPARAQEAVTSLGMKNSEIMASQMVSMETGASVSPSAVGYGQTQSQGIAFG